MKIIKLFILITILSIVSNCGKVGPLTLPEDKHILCRILENGEWGPLREIR